jgi:hypothetical protein
MAKTRMQIVNPTPSAVYHGVLQGTYRIATAEGISSLWRGMSSVVVGAGPAHAVYFATYEAVKHVMGANEVGKHHPVAAATSGACATIASDALMNPFDGTNSCTLSTHLHLGVLIVVLLLAFPSNLTPRQ